MDENKRGSFGSNIGFLMSAIGSAVGLGNIWGFPYKMGKSGGFTFLIIYLILAVFVGFAIMLSELAMGRKTGLGPVNAYKTLSKKFKWVGWLAILAPFLIMTFYSVLGGYCIYYIVINIVGLFKGVPGAESFSTLLTNPGMSILVMLGFMVICYLINLNGVGGGIEKFNKIGMPALFVMLVIVIIRAWTLPNAAEGLKFMFVPGYAVKGGFIEKAPGIMSVLATAGGQMFFSLSLAMGAMITYGSYLGKGENLPKNSVIIVISDTLVAIMAGLAVIPAAVANGIAKGMAVSEIKLGGPTLLFATLQDVFHDMGTIGGNLCNGAVSADTCAPVLALNGYLNIRGAEGERTIPALGFHTGPGRVALKRDEVLLSVEFRPEDWQGWGAAYHKYAMREAMDIATIGCAAAVRLDGTVISGIRLAYSVSAPIPVRCPSAEAAALGRSATPEALPATLAAISAAVEADVQPRTSWRANRDFRMHIIRTLAERVIARCVVRAVELQEAASC